MNKVVLLDDHNAITTGLKFSLEKSGHFRIDKVFNSANQLLEYLHSENIQLVISDINMPGESIFTIIPKVKKYFPSIKIVVYTMFDSEGYFRDARKVGVDGYILKTDELEDISSILQNVMSGIFYYSRSLRILLNEHNSFSEKEHLILKYLLKGHKPMEIAKILGKSKRMVEYHLSNIRDKMSVKSNMELLAKYKDIYYK